MSRTFFSWLLANRPLVLLLVAAALATGGWAWTRLPVDAFPDATNTQVMILTKSPGLSASDVEQRISFPIELAMGGLPRVLEVRSLSRSGLSQVVVVFEDQADTYWTRQQVFERLARARESLPPGVDPEMGPISTGLGEVFQYTLESDRLTAMELRSLQDWLVAPLLKPIPGVNEVNSFGGFVKQYQVVLDPDKLLQYGLTAGEVVAAIEANNTNAGGGVIVQGWEQMYLRGAGLLGGIPDLERIVLKSRDGVAVTLPDVAEITIGAETRQGAVSRDGKGETVAGMVIMLKGENSREVVRRVKQALDRIGATLPEGVRINVFYDRTSLIEACVATVRNALLEGAVFVVLVMVLFIAELRTALVVLFSLPLTFLISFLVMHGQGQSANLMTLGGLAFSVGMVVDASIVVVENIRRRLARLGPREPVRPAVIEGAVEVARPVAFSVLIIVLILVPLFTLQGIEGKMFEPLAWTLLLALAVSLVVALAVSPVLAEMVLRPAPEREFRFVQRFHDGYLHLLDRLRRWPRRTLGAALLLLAAASAAVPFLGTEFMPPLEEGALAINAVRLPNASLEGSVEVARFIEKRLLRFPEVATVVSKTGRAEISEDPMGPEQTDFFVMLKPRKSFSRGRSQAALSEAIGADLADIPGLRFSLSQPIALRVNELISGVKSDLAVKIFGPDLVQLKSLADRAAAQVRVVQGARDVKVEQVSGMNQLDAVIDRTALARYGLNIEDVNRLIETGVAGVTATTLVEGQQRYAVTVRFPENRRNSPEAVGRLLVPAPDGARVPLSELATLKVVEAPSQISRENGQRRIVVEANVRGRDLGGFVADVQNRLRDLVRDLPPGYFVDYGGQFENQQRALRQLSIVVPVVLVMILFLLALALRSFRAAGLVLLNLPFALVGGILAVLAFRMTLSVSAAVAFIVLLGIAVQNGVVLVATFGQLRREGLSVEVAVRQGCDRRFRPLLMTALTSFIGHLPMLYAMGAGAEIQRPLAVVVMGGLITCTALTLLVLPVMYQAAAGRRFLRWRR